MSAGDVAILNTKLDMLIDNFKSFKQFILGFIMAIAIPFAVYVVLEIANAKTDIAVMQERMVVNDKAIKEEQWMDLKVI